MENEALVPKLTSLWSRHKEDLKFFVFTVLIVWLVVLGVFLFGVVLEKAIEKENHVPDITIPSMDFMVLNITETHLSVKWDLLIRIPPKLPGYYMRLEGDFQVFIVYKGVTIATSSTKSYTLIPMWSKLLKMSLNASEGYMDGVIVKDIIEDVKERGEILFGSRLLLPDCRYGSSGKMNYACDEATIRFEPGSQRNATLSGNQPICLYLH